MEETTTRVGRTVTLPWAKARVEDEVVVEGSAGGERLVEVGVARLRERGDDGEELLRFFYRVDGRTVRGPLTLRPSEVDELAGMLAETPALRRLLRRLAGAGEEGDE
jgi:hypothetical protein